MDVAQYGTNGTPGTSTGGSGTAGSAGTSAYALNKGNGSDITNSAYAAGGFGGNGGRGTDKRDGTGGNAGAGGAGGAGTGRTIVSLAATELLEASARGRGGAGGNAGRPGNSGGYLVPGVGLEFPPEGNGANGGAGGAGTASASAVNSTGAATAEATAGGGRGGTGYGDGHGGGAGGKATVTAVKAIGTYAATARAIQVGGFGGDGRGGARAADGTESTIVDAVTGATDVGRLDLFQLAFGGSGGNDQQYGTGGAGAGGTSRLTFDDEAANATTSALLSVRSEAAGGRGGFSYGGSGGDGGDGLAEADIAGAHVVRVDVRAEGGIGGNAESDRTGRITPYGNGGTGGGARAVGRSSSTAPVAGLTYGSYVRAEAVGGAGGSGAGTGYSGGAGGAATATANAIGDGAYAYVHVRGGKGGTGAFGATGGAGAGVTLENAVKGTTNGTSLTLRQAAFGGAGGWGVDADGGVGGGARSVLTFDDTVAPVSASLLIGKAEAYGGAGGNSGVASFTSGGHTGAAADGSASTKLTSAGDVKAYAKASGGTAGRLGEALSGIGGAGNATAQAVSTGPDGRALARADARGGESEIADGFFGPALAEANSTASATTASGALAVAVAESEGSSGKATSTATTSGTGIVSRVSATASALTDGRTTTESRAQAGTVVLPTSEDLEAYSYATVLPSPDFVGAALGTNTRVNGSFGNPAATVFAAGVMGVSANFDQTIGTGFASTIDWTLDTTATSGHLVLGLLDTFLAGSSAFSLNLQVSIEGVIVTNRSFTNMFAATLFTDDNPLDLGAVARKPDLSVSVRLTMGGGFPLSVDFGIDYILGFTTEGLDTTAPRAPTLILPAASDSGVSTLDGLTNIKTPTVRGQGEPNSRITVYDGATALGTVTANADASWSLALASPLADGVHVLTAKSTDLNGNTSLASQPLRVQIDTQAPTLAGPPDLLAGSDSGALATDNVTRETTLRFGGRTEGDATVILFDGATELGRTQAGALGNWAFRTDNLAPGQHAISARALDAAGNLGAVSFALDVTIDTTAPDAPTVPDLAPGSDTGRSASDNLTHATALLFTGRADPAGVVTLFDGETAIGTGKVGALGNWAIQAATLGGGVHEISARVTDAAGNASAASAALTVTIDTAAPDAPAAPDLAPISDTGRSGADNLTRDMNPVFRGRTEGAARVSLFDGDTVIGTGTVGALGNWAVQATTLAEGTHAITARVADAAGNISAASDALVVTIDTTAPAAQGKPNLAATSDDGASSIDNRTSIASPIFNGRGEAGGRMTLMDGAEEIGSVTVGPLGNWTIQSKALGVGTHQVSAVLTDAAGNHSPASAPLEVVVTPTPPLSASLEQPRALVPPLALEPMAFLSGGGDGGLPDMAGPFGADVGGLDLLVPIAPPLDMVVTVPPPPSGAILDAWATVGMMLGDDGGWYGTGARP